MQHSIAKIENVRLVAAASAVGHEEYAGPLGQLFDFHDDTDRFGAKTWELAEGEMAGCAMNFALKAASWSPDLVDALFAGDLQNQCVATAHGSLPFGIPYVGLYGACSTCTEGLMLASLVLDGGHYERAAVVTSSHNCAAERQFRLPLEYGGQRTPTAQWTATASGAFLLERGAETGVHVRAAMIGRMIDGGIRDAANMGAAMAPAAADSILRFLAESGTSPEDYDKIVTGDLGREGSALLLYLLEREGVKIAMCHEDCGCLMYHPEKQDAHAGGSGCGCSAAVLAAHYLPKLRKREYKRILFLSTGALMSPSSVAQGENIFGVAPAVLLEAPEAGLCPEPHQGDV